MRARGRAQSYSNDVLAQAKPDKQDKMVPRHKDRRAAALFLSHERPESHRSDFSAFVFGSEVSWNQGRDMVAALLESRARAAPVCPESAMSLMVPFEQAIFDPEESGAWESPWSRIPIRLNIQRPILDGLLDPLDDDVWDRGSAGSDHVEHQHQHAVAEHAQHHPHDDAMTDIGVALVSSGTTIFLAFMSAIFAMRLFREMMRPQGQQMQMNAGADGDVPGVLQLDIPGVQPFRPFSGQGYRLVVESDSSKPEPEVSPAHMADQAEKRGKDTPRSLSPVSAVSASAQPSGASTDARQSGLPQFGVSDDIPEVTASAVVQ